MSKKKAELKSLRITLVRSPIGYTRDQRATAKSLGLRKLNASVVQLATPQVLGMINSISHLVRVEEVTK